MLIKQGYCHFFHPKVQTISCSPFKLALPFLVSQVSPIFTATEECLPLGKELEHYAGYKTPHEAFPQGLL